LLVQVVGILLFDDRVPKEQTLNYQLKQMLSIEYYYNQFSKGKLVYPPNASSETIRTDLIVQFQGMTVKMHPYGKERGNAKIEVTCGESQKNIDVQTGKSVFVWKWSLPQEKQDMLDNWLYAHRDELLEMWETRTVKPLPPPDKEPTPAK